MIMNNMVGLKQLREQMHIYVDQVKKGKSFIVLRKSAPLFKISPIEEENWEEVIDFTKLKKGGVHIDELLKRL